MPMYVMTIVDYPIRQEYEVDVSHEYFSNREDAVAGLREWAISDDDGYVFKVKMGKDGHVAVAQDKYGDSGHVAFLDKCDDM